MIEMINKNDIEEINLTEIINKNSDVSMILFDDDVDEIIDHINKDLVIDEESKNCIADIVILSRVGNELILEDLFTPDGRVKLIDSGTIYYDTELIDLIDFEKLYADEIIEIEFDDQVEESEDVESIYDEMIEELLASYDVRQAMHEIARIAYEDGRKTLALELSENMNEIVGE